MIDWAKIHDQEGFSALTPVLAGFSLVYGAAVRMRMMAYPSEKKKSLPGFVVSVGNITSGGTGKTPAAIMIAQWAASEGFHPAVLSRGYGGKRKQAVVEVSDGKNLLALPEEAGDEPYLMAKKLPGIPVIVSPSRFHAGLLAHRKHGADFFILDDGFQHIHLKRDFDLVLMDSRRPFGNGRLLPWGPLREPVRHLSRADAFVLTRADAVSENATRAEEEFLRGKFQKPVFLSKHIPEKIVFPHEDKEYNVGFLKGKRVTAFAGLARPDAFRETLSGLGAEVLSFKAFKDHHVYAPGQLRLLSREKSRTGADCLITTEKDWVRIERASKEWPDFGYLSVKFAITEGTGDFHRLLKEKAGKSKSGDRMPGGNRR